MNHCSIQHTCFASGKEMGSSPIVACPTPRKLKIIDMDTTLVQPSFTRFSRWHLRNQPEISAAEGGIELLGINMPEVGRGSDHLVTQTSSSPPFFSGSPPSRVSNPLTQDSRFGDKKFTPFSPRKISAPLGIGKPSPSSACIGTNFTGSTVVRIEGFKCLNRERRNPSIPALA